MPAPAKIVLVLFHCFIYVKNYSFKHTCNDDDGIGRRKQQKLAYRIFTGKFQEDQDCLYPPLHQIRKISSAVTVSVDWLHNPLYGPISYKNIQLK